MYLAVVLTALLTIAQTQAAAISKWATLDECLENASVPTDAQGSDDWDQDVGSFNNRLQYTPVAIAVPTNIAQIQAAVSCGAEAGIKVTPKAGGHSYTSLGLGGEDGHLVVELDRMYNVTLNTTTNIATVQPGARLGHVATQLWNQGKRAFSHGTCPGVGVSGHALHGGFGFSSHKYGLATDWIVGATVVLANSSIVQTSATEHPDLFWAIKGAGSNFGIVVSYEFDTFAAPDEVTYFSIPFVWDANSSVTNLEILEDYAQNTMPSDLNMRMSASGALSKFEGMYYGGKTDLQAALQPLLDKLNLRLSQMTNTTWMGAFTYYAGGATDPTYPYSSHETFFSKSLMLKGLNGTSAENFVDYWLNQGPANSRSWYVRLYLHGGKNSAVSSGDHSMSSYAHRDKLYMLEFFDQVYVGDFPEDGFSFLDEWVGNITAPLPTSDWGMYINYADSTLNGTFAQKAYWRESLPKLRQIKAEVDPQQLFYYPQSVIPAAESLLV